MKNSLTISFFASLILWSAASTADNPRPYYDEAELNPYYIGFGLTASEPDDDSNFKNATGFQIYGGYKLDYKLADTFNISIEAGYNDTGDFDGSAQIVNGSIVYPDSFNTQTGWAAGVLSYNIYKRIDVQGTLGLEAGDEDGVIFGGGFDYHLDRRFDLKLAVIKRSESLSTQFNITYQF